MTTSNANFFPGSTSSVNSTFEDVLKAIDKAEQGMSTNLAMIDWCTRKIESTEENINQMLASNEADCAPYITREVIEYQQEMLEQCVTFRVQIVERFVEMNQRLSKLDEFRAMVDEAMTKLLPAKSEKEDGDPWSRDEAFRARYENKII